MLNYNTTIEEFALAIKKLHVLFLDIIFLGMPP
jgi:hypothetical protein